MTKMLVGIHGKPRAGKDTLAKYLREKYKLFQFGPSVAVKATAAAMFNVPLNCFYDDNLKEQIDPFWQISYREMAQKVGKESSRDIFGEDIWMRHVAKMRAELPADCNGLIFADIRYQNEAVWVRNNGGLVVFVTRENRSYVANETHAAEQGLSTEFADVIIPNNGTFEELFKRADLVVGPLLES